MGVADCCSIVRGEWEGSGRSSREVPGGSGGVGSCYPTRLAHSGLLGPWAWNWGWRFGIEAGPSPLPLAFPHCPPSFWALAPSYPWLCLQSPPGGREEAQRAQNSGCPRSQVFARAVRDSQACGEFSACGAGGGSRVGRQAGGGKLGLPLAQ
jgi:hypothetical protein